jgi:hypothetical protein
MHWEFGIDEHKHGGQVKLFDCIMVVYSVVFQEYQHQGASATYGMIFYALIQSPNHSISNCLFPSLI